MSDQRAPNPDDVLRADRAGPPTDHPDLIPARRARSSRSTGPGRGQPGPRTGWLLLVGAALVCLLAAAFLARALIPLPAGSGHRGAAAGIAQEQEVAIGSAEWALVPERSAAELPRG